jgi:hypothetical protein
MARVLTQLTSLQDIVMSRYTRGDCRSLEGTVRLRLSVLGKLDVAEWFRDLNGSRRNPP